MLQKLKNVKQQNKKTSRITIFLTTFCKKRKFSKKIFLVKKIFI